MVNKEDVVTDIQNSLNNRVCEDAGIMPVSIEKGIIEIGAMNPDFIRVKEVISDIKRRFNVEIILKQVTASEWEEWFESSSLLSANNKNITKNVTDNSNQQIISEYDSSEILSDSYKENNEYVSSENLSNSYKEDNESVLSLDEDNEENNLSDQDFNDKTIITQNNNFEDHNEFDYEDSKNDNALIKLAKTNLGEDFENDSDSFFGDEVTNSNDPVISGVASLLSKCFSLHASDVHVEPLEDRLRIRYRIDGMLEEVFAFPKSHISPIVSRIKIMSNLDIAEKRIPQDGRIRCLLRGRKSDFRVSTLPGKWGEKVVLRVLESDTSVLNLTKLVTEKSELDLIRLMSKTPYGIVIVVGPTGSGKSTTLYSMLSELNTPGVNISTVEDPVEYTLDGIHQVQVIREKGLDFSRALRSLMRQDPDIILVGETRDKETAQAAMEAALTGHMVFTTLHANDTATAITRLSEMNIPPYLIGASIIGVVAQRLVRKVCLSCSFTRTLKKGKDDRALKYGLNKARMINESNNIDNQLCPVCGGSGYKGRVGIYEVMKINENLRELIMKESTADVIRAKAFLTEGRSLIDYGMELVKKELTTIEEVERVCLLEEPMPEEL